MGTIGSIDGVVNNVGVFFSKRFTDYTVHDFRAALRNQSAGIRLHYPACREADAGAKDRREHPIAGVNASIPMITKGHRGSFLRPHIRLATATLAAASLI
jgi:hypothetical protein